eukprot:3771134-Prymnesium_polylepis.2
METDGTLPPQLAAAPSATTAGRRPFGHDLKRQRSEDEDPLFGATKQNRSDRQRRLCNPEP